MFCLRYGYKMLKILMRRIILPLFSLLVAVHFVFVYKGKNWFSVEIPSVVNKGSVQIKLDVPLIRQKPLLCFSTSLSMMLEFWFGQEFVPEEIENSCMQYSLWDYVANFYAGTFYFNRSRTNEYLSRKNCQPVNFICGQFRVRFFGNTVENYSEQEMRDYFNRKIKNLLLLGVPVGVSLRMSDDTYFTHAVVVTGYNESRGEVYINNPASGSLIQEKISYQEFFHKWLIRGGGNFFAIMPA